MILLCRDLLPTEYENVAALTTLHENPHLFKITTPIDIGAFESALAQHPNQPFVKSVMIGLHEGFWPWANTRPTNGYPITWDHSHMSLRTKMEQQFISEYKDSKLAAGQFSPPFGPELLPGMYSTPVHVVPKPHSEGLWLVSNMSAGVFASNMMIKHVDIAGVQLDMLHNFFAALLRFHCMSDFNANANLVAWKSDVLKAYRICPMSPLWQLKQIVTTGYLTDAQKAAGYREVIKCSVDNNNNFRGQGSFCIFYSVNGLITWIAINVEDVEDLFCYSDDDFSWDLATLIAYYEPYGEFFPVKQVKLMQLWDRLGVPHSRIKQVSGRILAIINFDIDVNKMTVTLPPTSKEDLLSNLKVFIASTQRPLTDFHQILGWSNWSFNIFPLIKLGLCNLYKKMAGKENGFALMHINEAIKDDLKWMVRHISECRGMLCFKAKDWDPYTEAMSTLECDVCLTGMGFYHLQDRLSFVCLVPDLVDEKPLIFFFEALCMCCAVHWSAKNHVSSTTPLHLTLKTDNHNTIDIFNMLKVMPLYNPILKSTVDMLIEYDIDLHVVHIPGVRNVVADALLRSKLDKAAQLCPGLDIERFQPPSDIVMGVARH